MSGSGSSAQFGQMAMDVPVQYRPTPVRNEPGEGQVVSVDVPTYKVRHVTSSGHILNGFSPGANLWGLGATYENSRRRTEEELFDVPRDADHTQRPVYGYLRKTEHPGPTQYGDTTLDLHTSGRRVTTTPGDSLDNFVEHDPNNNSGWGNGFGREAVEDLDEHHDAWDTSGDYREVQIHGGPLSTKHITGATVHRDPRVSEFAESAVKHLRAARIPTRVMEFHNYQPTLDESQLGKGKTDWVNIEAYQRDKR